MDANIVAQRVREVIDYDPATGVFTRKIRLAQRHQVGDRADFIVTGGGLAGYRRVSFDSKRYLAHRVAWLYVYGEWPSKHIDHINGDRGDNRIENLRDVPEMMNHQNLRKARSDNQSGLLGVSILRGKSYRADIQSEGKRLSLGTYKTPEEAHKAYLSAKRQLHKGCTI